MKQKINIKVVFRHKWDSFNKQKIMSDFNVYKIGLWAKKYKIVGVSNFNNVKEWNLVNEYMFGIDFIFIKLWITFNVGGMNLVE